MLAGTVVFGFVVHELAERWRPSLVEGTTFGQARIDELVDSWVLLPEGIVAPDGLPSGPAGRLLYVGLVAAILALTLVRSRLWRAVGLVPVLYLAACVWENLLVAQPAVARFVLIGAMLVGADGVPAAGALRATTSGDRVMDRAAAAPGEGVSLSFGGLACLSDLDLVVGEGEIVSVIGPNGAGKTSLFNVITGVYPPDRGRSCSKESRSSGSTRTRSPGAGSPAPSRRCGSS